MAESVLDYEKRPARYSAVDGVDEILVGFLFLSLTVTTHLANVAVAGSVWRSKYTLLAANGLILLVFFVLRAVLKTRITFRRTGYVKYRYSKFRATVGAVVGGTAGVLALALVVKMWSPAERERDLIILGGVLWAAFYIYFYIYRFKMHSLWRWIVAACIAAGPLVIYYGFRDVRDISTISGGVLGACFLVSGVVTFCTYIRHTKPAEMGAGTDAR